MIFKNLSSLDIPFSAVLLSLKSWLYWLFNISSSLYTEILLTAATENPVFGLLFSPSWRGPLTTQPSTVFTAYGPFPWLLTASQGSITFGGFGSNQHVNFSIYGGDPNVREVRPLCQLFLCDNVVRGHRHFTLSENLWKTVEMVIVQSSHLQTIQHIGGNNPFLSVGLQQEICSSPSYVQPVHKILWTGCCHTVRIQKCKGLFYCISLPGFPLDWQNGQNTVLPSSPCMTTCLRRGGFNMSGFFGVFAFSTGVWLFRNMKHGRMILATLFAS